MKQRNKSQSERLRSSSPLSPEQADVNVQYKVNKLKGMIELDDDDHMYNVQQQEPRLFNQQIRMLDCENKTRTNIIKPFSSQSQMIAHIEPVFKIRKYNRN